MDDDEIIGDDLLTPGAGARKLYENIDPLDALGNINKSGGGSWLFATSSSSLLVEEPSSFPDLMLQRLHCLEQSR